MGNFEKLVVLTVLFLSAIVLAVSLNSGRKKAERSSPVDIESAVSAAADNPLGAGLERDLGAGKASDGLLLSTEVTPPAVPAGSSEEPAPVDGSILLDTSELRKAGLDDYMVYTALAGDTWAGLAERFYGSGRYVTLLRHANEDMVSPLAGESILVPVRDLSAEAGKRAPHTVRENAGVALGESEEPIAGANDEVAGGDSAAPARTRATEPASKAPSTAADLSGVTVYEVRSGDSLTAIAQRVYGTAARWNVLYEANRAQLPSPDWLTVGMKLTVPRGSALQALAAAEPSTAATTASAPRTGGEPTVKKGKVR